MAKKRGKPSRPPRRQHLRSLPTISDGESSAAEDSASEQELFQDLRRGLRADGPVDLLVAVSGVLTVVDARTRDPFKVHEERLSLDEIVDSFVGTDYAETTAALSVIAVLSPDELMARRIAQVLASRRQPMPGWLAGLRDAAVSRVFVMTHVQGDGDDYFLEVGLPTGEQLTALVYVDHNLGTVVKDAFVIPGSAERVLARIEEVSTDPDQKVTEVDPATARAVIEDAIDHGARMYPPLESDSWPMCRPLVDWMVRLLPSGGRLPERPQWTEEELAAMREEFFTSSYGQPMDNEDERSLLQTLNWFGTDYGPGDPLRWSPVNVEMLLADWLPRKVVADTPYLAKAPSLLRAYIEWCHDRRGIRRELTDETLAAVDEWEPDFQREIRSSRPHGPEALLEALLVDRDGDPAYAQLLLEGLDRAVGSRRMLLDLDDAPLPDEPFEWAGVPDDIHDRVNEVLELCDRCGDELLDVEHRTAMRRFLGRAAVGDPTIFRRKGAANRAAAAVAWIIAKANDTIGYSGWLQSQELEGWFGTKGVSQRGNVFLQAIGVNPYDQFGAMELGSPDFLVAERRRTLTRRRDECLAMLES